MSIDPLPGKEKEKLAPDTTRSRTEMVSSDLCLFTTLPCLSLCVNLNPSYCFPTSPAGTPRPVGYQLGIFKERRVNPFPPVSTLQSWEGTLLGLV